MAIRYARTCFDFYLLCFLRRDPASVGSSREIPIEHTYCVLYSLPSLLFFIAFFLLSSCLPLFLPPISSFLSTKPQALGREQWLAQWLSWQKEPQMGHWCQPAMFQAEYTGHCPPGLQNLTYTVLCPFPCLLPHMGFPLFLSSFLPAWLKATQSSFRAQLKAWLPTLSHTPFFKCRACICLSCAFWRNLLL